jgi:PadR family transcriptional regulator PadR
MAEDGEEAAERLVTHGSAPLRAPTFFILLSLASGSKHGYAILKDVAALSEGAIVLSAGTLYEALGRLLAQGLVARTPDDDGQPMGPTRKAYRLTDAGRQALEAETNRMDRLVALARRRLAPEEP